jgi:predicted DNA-binding ribbon-helix-helix protein
MRDVRCLHHAPARQHAIRTTLALDDDLLACARHLAEREKKTLGEVISELARSGLARNMGPALSVRNGVLLLSKPAGTPPVTLEVVNQLRDEAP